MRKLAIRFASLLAIAAICFLGVMHWVQTRAEDQIRQAFSALRPLLASATHGPVVVSPWDRSVLIPDVVLIPHNAIGAAATTIASITASGIFNNAGQLSASRISVKDIQSSGPSLADAGALTRTTVPEVTLEGVTIDHAAIQSATSAAPIAAILIGAITASSVSVPGLKSVTIFPAVVGGAARPDAVFGAVEQVHRDIKVNDLRAGTIGVMTTGNTAISAIIAGANPATMTAEIKDSALSDLDLGVVLSLFDATTALAATPTGGGLKTLLRHGSSGAIIVQREGAAVARLATAEIGAIAVEPARIQAAIRTLQAPPPVPGQRATRKQEQAGQDAAMSLYENVAVDRLEINGLDVALGGSARAKLDRLRTHDLQGGKLASLSITGLNALSPTQGKITADRFGLKGWNLLEMIRLHERLGPDRSNAMQSAPAVLWPLLLRLFESVDVEQLMATGQPQGRAIVIDQFYAARGPIIGQTPASGQLKARFRIPVNGSDTSTAALLARHGVSRADIRLEGGWNWQETAKTLTLGPVEGAMADIGTLTAKLKLTNVSRMALISRADLMPAAIQAITLGPVEITVRDHGLVKMVGNDAAFEAEQMQALKHYVGMIDTPGSPLPSIMDGVGRFLAQPGSQLAVVFTPRQPLSIGSIVSAGQAEGELMPLLASQSDVRITAK
jgi:hypothetical protein